MYKHECVQCSKSNGYICPLNVGIIDRFLGNVYVTNCWKYQELVKKKK